MDSTKQSNTFTQVSQEDPQPDQHSGLSKIRTGNSESMHSYKSHKSRYTNTSKLTQSKLFKAISKANLHEKNDQLLE